MYCKETLLCDNAVVYVTRCIPDYGFNLEWVRFFELVDGVWNCTHVYGAITWLSMSHSEVCCYEWIVRPI